MPACIEHRSADSFARDDDLLAATTKLARKVPRDVTKIQNRVVILALTCFRLEEGAEDGRVSKAACTNSASDASTSSGATWLNASHDHDNTIIQVVCDKYCEWLIRQCSL